MNVFVFRNSLFTLAFAMLFLAGCKKDLEPKKLITGSWKLTALTADVPYDWNNDGQTETNLYGVFTTCEKDNNLTLYSGGTGTAKGYCNQPNVNIQWFTNGVVDYLEIWDSRFAGKYEVVKLDSKTLIMRQRVFLRTDYHTYTFTKQ